MRVTKNYPLATTIFLNDFLAGTYRENEENKKIYPVGVIPICGFLCSESLEKIKVSLIRALQAVDVKEIVFLVDSPGGDVAGVDELSNMIFNSRAQKPSVAIVKEACSAAYWLASAASKVVLEGKTSVCGSIGIIAVHEDISEALKQQGIQRTEIFAGDLKTAGTSSKPLDEAGRKELEEKVSYFYDLFLKAVSRNRNISIDRVDRTAKIFIGIQCISNNLADSFINEGDNMTPEEIQKLQQEIEMLKQENLRLMEELKKYKEQPEEMEEKEEVVPQAQEMEEKPEEEKKVEDVVAKAIARERERLLALDSICVPGFEACVATAKATGKSAQETSFEILKAQAKNKMYALRAESVVIPGMGGTVEMTDDDKRKQMAAMIAKSGKGVK